MILFLMLCILSLGSCHDIPHIDCTKSSATVASSADVLDIVNAVGGADMLSQITSFIYNGGEIFRSASLGQTYNIDSLDQSVAAGGSQTTSFRIEESGLLSRIDRAYVYDQYWAWAFANLAPAINMSLVIHDTEQQYACFIAGTNSFEVDTSKAQGYTDGLLTDYLLHLAHQLAFPWLLQTFLSNATMLYKYEVREPYSMAIYNALEASHLGLTLLYDANTKMPHAVRSHEDHIVFGPSTSDIIFTNFKNVSVNDGSNITLPHRMQTVYNSRFVLEDFSIDSITINPSLPTDYFEGRAPPADPSGTLQGLEPVGPQSNVEYPLSEVHEFFESGLWAGAFGNMYNTSDVMVAYPDPECKNIMTIYIAFPDYVQVLVEHDEGFIITDAAGHRSKIILEWLKENRPDKKITHVVPSHHHRDHAGGVEDYLDAGAALVVPYVARDYYLQAKPSREDYRVVTYDEHNPFVFKDSSIEFRSYWSHDNPHAEDWSFAVASKADPTDSDLFVVFVADVVNPGTEAINWENDVAREFMISAAKACVPQATICVGAHGSVSGTEHNTSAPLRVISEGVGFSYPKMLAEDWQTCLERH